MKKIGFCEFWLWVILVIYSKPNNNNNKHKIIFIWPKISIISI